MELHDYLAALRRRWPVWVGTTVLGALLGTLVLVLTPSTYQATAQVFASVSPSIPNSASFINQRIKSYPDVVISEAVLGPVADQLELAESVRELRASISATNPRDTSQVEIAVRGGDPARAAAIANAVAAQFTEVVEELETPSSGNRPVELTVTDPANAPVAPVAPVASHLVGLGLVVGLFLGLAGAIVRDRLDDTVHTAEDAARAWPGDGTVEVLAPLTGRARRSALTGRPAVLLARRLEAAAEEGPVHVLLLCPAPTEALAPLEFAEDVAAVLRGRGMSVAVGCSAGGGEDARVRLEVADPMAPLREWREATERSDDVVLVIPAGQVARAELRELRRILGHVGLHPLAIALIDHRTRSAPDGPPSAEVRAVPPRGASPTEAATVTAVTAGAAAPGAPAPRPPQR
ncbi:YveK family protein [Blastococcus sp. SYSU DS1021]